MMRDGSARREEDVAGESVCSRSVGTGSGCVMSHFVKSLCFFRLNKCRTWRVRDGVECVEQVNKTRLLPAIVIRADNSLYLSVSRFSGQSYFPYREIMPCRPSRAPIQSCACRASPCCRGPGRDTCGGQIRRASRREPCARQRSWPDGCQSRC